MSLNVSDIREKEGDYSPFQLVAFLFLALSCPDIFAKMFMAPC
jgi:hypothetical protein